MFRKMTSSERALALGLATAGAAAMVFAIAHRWKPGDMNPGIEGCLTAGIVGFVVALLHPMRYVLAVTLCAPIVAVEYGASVLADGPAVGVVGVQLVVMGLIGLSIWRVAGREAEHERFPSAASSTREGVVAPSPSLARPQESASF